MLTCCRLGCVCHMVHSHPVPFSTHVSLISKFQYYYYCCMSPQWPSPPYYLVYRTVPRPVNNCTAKPDVLSTIKNEEGTAPLLRLEQLYIRR